MKAGTRISFSTSPGSPSRTFGTFAGENGDDTIVAVDGTHGVNPLVSVNSNRVAEVKEGESFSQHTQRVNDEARAAAKAEALKRQQAAAAKAKKTDSGAVAAVVALALLLFGAFQAKAASGILTPDPAVNVFTTWTTNQQVTPSYAVVSARSGNGGTPVVTFINAGSDLTSAKVTAYKVTSKIVVTGAGSSTRLDVISTNTGVNWQSGTIIIQHKVDDSYEKRTLTSNTGSTNIVVTVAPMGTMVAGDTIYFAVAGPVIFWGASTNSLSSVGGIINGQQNLPLLIEITGTSNLGMNSVAGFYAPPVTIPRPGL
jgi:hypothetical protein